MIFVPAAVSFHRRVLATRDITLSPYLQSPPLHCSCLVLLISVISLAGFPGCGPASPDNAPNIGPPESVGGAHLSKQGSSPGPASGTRAFSRGDSTSLGDRPQTQPVGTATSKTEGRDQSPVPLISVIPDSVAKDLASPYADVRLRTLDHWDANKTTAPLDPVFDALEDENEAVRSKATQIIEQRFAAEQALGRD